MRVLGWVCGLLVATIAVAGDLPQPLPNVTHPEDNPTSAAKVELGRRLFHDRRLSRNGTVSCASCHLRARHFSDGRRLAVGIEKRVGRRHTPNLVNVGHAKQLMWDGRATTLEEQALLPIQNPVEMDLSLEELERRLARVPDYRFRFGEVFDEPPTAANVARALATFQRSIVSNRTPFDRHLAGETDALTPAAKRGMELFYGRARCFVCHAGANLSDGAFHNVGIVTPGDAGRFEVTAEEADRAAFRTPQLREIGRTAPYMHDGRFATLSEVVEHYNFGGVTDDPNPNRDERLEVLYLAEDEVADLVAFLRDGLTTPRK